MRRGLMVVRDSTSGATSRRDFRLFWLAGAVSQFGSQASGLALPILVLGVGGSALAAGALGTTAALADAVLAPFAGVLADRHSRRSMLVVSALVAGCAMGAVAAGVVTHAASLTLLFCAAAVEGAATAGYAAAAAGAIRSVLPADRPERALGTLQSREQAARLAGPGLGGGLYSLAPWAPFLADAVSYLLASVCVGAIRADLRPDRTPGPAPTFVRELREGLGFVWQRPFLRFVALWAGGVNLVFGALSLDVILVARLRGDSAASIGAALTGAGVAGLVGALLAPRVLGRLRAGVLVVGASWLMAAAVLPMTVLTSIWADGALLSAVALLTPGLSIVFQTRSIMVTPDRLQGRVGTALGTLAQGMAIAAPLVAGLLVHGVPPPLIPVPFCAALVVLAGYATANSGRLRAAPAESGEHHRSAPAPADG